MIIGNGDIASVLTDREDFTFFACGVSDSSERSEKEFNREIFKLLEQDPNKRLVYFSSLSIYYKDTPYTRHKRKIENIIKAGFEKYCIIRIGNITWGKNPNTILNHFKNNPNAEIQEGYRYLIEKEEFLHWINLIPNFNTEMNLTGTLTTIKQVYERAIHTNE